MATMSFCPHCGAKQEQVAAFCGECGKNVPHVNPPVKSGKSKKSLIIAAVGIVAAVAIGFAAWQLFFTPLSLDEYSERTTELWQEFFDVSLDAEIRLGEIRQDYGYSDLAALEDIFGIVNDSLRSKQGIVNQIERLGMPSGLTDREKLLLEEFISATSHDLDRYISFHDDLQDLYQRIPEDDGTDAEWSEFSREFSDLSREHFGAELHEDDFIFRTELRMYSFLEQDFDGWSFRLNDVGHQIDNLARRLGWERAARNFRADSLFSWGDYESFIEEVNSALHLSDF